jgi:hypothetical protein
MSHGAVDISRSRQRLPRNLPLNGGCGRASELEATDRAHHESMCGAKLSVGMRRQVCDGDVVASKDRMICRVEIASESLCS